MLSVMAALPSPMHPRIRDGLRIAFITSIGRVEWGSVLLWRGCEIVTDLVGRSKPMNSRSHSFKIVARLIPTVCFGSSPTFTIHCGCQTGGALYGFEDSSGENSLRLYYDCAVIGERVIFERYSTLEERLSVAQVAVSPELWGLVDGEGAHNAH